MLYHISLNIGKKIKEFKPKVPRGKCVIVNENVTIPRICLSNSLEGCLTGVPWGGYNLITDSPLNSDQIITFARIYEFDETKIEEQNILFPHEVQKYVLDAEISGEHWVVNQTIVPEKSYVIVVKNFDIDCVNLKSNNKTYRIYVIKNPEYKILSKEIEDLWVNAINIEDDFDREKYVAKNYEKLLSVFK